MNKEQKTIKKIQELVPDILELKKGCKIYIEGCDHEFEYICKDYNGSTNRYVLFTKDGGYAIVPQPSYVTVIGRDITLEDVLVAMMKKNLFIEICNGDEDYIWFNGDGEARHGTIWQLNKPFHLQPQETKDFIGDLLLTK